MEKNMMAAVAATRGFVLESIDKSVIYLIHTSFFLMRARPAGPEVAPLVLPPSSEVLPSAAKRQAKQFHVGRAALNTSLDHVPIL